MVEFSWVDAVTIILFILGVYFVLTRIFGHSATELVIGVTLFGVILGLVFINREKISGLNREVGEIKVGVKHNFSAIRNGFDKMKQDMSALKQDIGALKQDMGEVKNLIRKK